MKFRLSVQFPSKTDPIIKCFKHFQIFQISNFGQNHLIFEKSGNSAKIGLFSIFFVSTPLLYATFDGTGRFPQKCIFLFRRIPTLRDPTIMNSFKKIIDKIRYWARQKSCAINKLQCVRYIFCNFFSIFINSCNFSSIGNVKVMLFSVLTPKQIN